MGSADQTLDDLATGQDCPGKIGGAGRDLILGGPGNDTLSGGGNNELLGIFTEADYIKVRLLRRRRVANDFHAVSILTTLAFRSVSIRTAVRKAAGHAVKVGRGVCVFSCIARPRLCHAGG